jgi:hypothetical protein
MSRVVSYISSIKFCRNATTISYLTVYYLRVFKTCPHALVKETFVSISTQSACSQALVYALRVLRY